MNSLQKYNVIFNAIEERERELFYYELDLSNFTMMLEMTLPEDYKKNLRLRCAEIRSRIAEVEAVKSALASHPKPGFFRLWKLFHR